MKELKTTVEVLSPDEIELIHESSLEVLETVGVRVPNQRVLDLLQHAGARVEQEAQVAKLPRRMMEGIIAAVPKAAHRPGKQGEKPCTAKGNLTGGLSTQIPFVSYTTKERRPGTTEDILKGIVVCDYLDNIPYASSVVVPHDVPYEIADVIAYQLLYTYSSKPGGTYILSADSARSIIEMARVMGKQVGYGLETVSPLQFRDVSLDIALVFAENDLPLGVGPMVIGGATGPVSIAGTLVVQNAEVLASIAVIYLLNPDQPMWYSGPSHSMDLRSTLCSFGSPNQTLIGLGTVQMARRYGLQASANVGLTDALVPDFQCGFEKGVSAALAVAGGIGGIGGQGIVGADQGVSLEQLVIDNEWIGALNYIFRGFEVSEETIGLDTIKKVGIGGHYLTEEHTCRYMRDHYWPSELFNRDNWATWLSKGGKDILALAAEKVQRILKEHYPPQPVIDDDKVKELQAIVDRARAQRTAS